MQKKKKNVYLYIPNIVGYMRVILALFAFILSRRNLLVFLVFYTTSQILDAVDGWTARKLKQASIFGQVLDQITDRLSTGLLYLLNSNVYDDYLIVLGFVMIADIGGHYFYSTSCAISGNRPHKKIENGSRLLKLYYERQSVMVICIIAYESFLLTAYVLKVTDPASYLHYLSLCIMFVSFPLAAFKMFTNISQGLYGMKQLVALDLHKDA